MKHKSEHLDHKSNSGSKMIEKMEKSEHHMVGQHEMGGGRAGAEERTPMPKASMDTGRHEKGESEGRSGSVPPTPEMTKGPNFPMARNRADSTGN